MLELRPNCECCDADLPPSSDRAMICSFECTFCRDCAEGVLADRCPNCGGTFNMVAARTADSASHAERRVVARHRVTTSGSIEFGRGQLACMVRNLFAAGAGLDSTGRARIPQRFTLIAGGLHLPCRVIWRRAGRIGIAFD